MARPHGHPLDPKNPGPIHHGIATLQSRGRLELPADVLAGLKRVEAPAKPTEALATRIDQGRIALNPWLPDGKKIADRRLEFLEEIAKGADPAVVRSLRRLEQRYRRVVIDVELRMTCPPGLLLDLRLLQHRAAHAWRIGENIELISVDQHDLEMDGEDSRIDDLP